MICILFHKNHRRNWPGNAVVAIWISCWKYILGGWLMTIMTVEGNHKCLGDRNKNTHSRKTCLRPEMSGYIIILYVTWSNLYYIILYILSIYLRFLLCWCIRCGTVVRPNFWDKARFSAYLQLYTVKAHRYVNSMYPIANPIFAPLLSLPLSLLPKSMLFRLYIWENVNCR